MAIYERGALALNVGLFSPNPRAYAVAMPLLHAWSVVR